MGRWRRGAGALYFGNLMSLKVNDLAERGGFEPPVEVLAPTTV
jgi:hypothetical protein